MLDRFYLSGPWEPEVVLEGPEAHHLGRVLRAGPGTRVELFDGAGSWAQAEVVNVGKRDVELRLITAVMRDPDPRWEVTLAVAPPKGERFRWLVEKATELGVDRIVPLRTQRTVVEPGVNKLDKLRQVALEACKQSRRNRLPRIDDLVSLEDWLHQSGNAFHRRYYGDQHGGSLTAEPPFVERGTCAAMAMIGPEGGFTPQEMEKLDAIGVVPISLSSQVLRIETAAIAFAVVLCDKVSTILGENP